MKEYEYEVLDDLDEVWYTAKTLQEAKKMMKQISSEKENDWLKFRIEKVCYTIIERKRYDN